MSLEAQLKRLEQSIGVVEDCPLCAARATKQRDERDNGLRVVESWVIHPECPQCGRPFTVQIDLVERAGV